MRLCWKAGKRGKLKMEREARDAAEMVNGISSQSASSRFNGSMERGSRGREATQGHEAGIKMLEKQQHQFKPTQTMHQRLSYMILPVIRYTFVSCSSGSLPPHPFCSYLAPVFFSSSREGTPG